MQFFVTAYDGNDEEASDRRLAAREEHLKATDKMAKEGKYIYAGAILDDNEKMIGSVLIVDFPSKEELEQCLKAEPYVVKGVWKHIEIKPCKPGPMFANTSK